MLESKAGKNSSDKSVEKNPGSIVFILEQNGFSPNKELTVLRLIMLHDKRYYIFLDFPKGETQRLRETGIPFHKGKNGIANLDEDEVKSFLEKQFESAELEGLFVLVNLNLAC